MEAKRIRLEDVKNEKNGRRSAHRSNVGDKPSERNEEDTKPRSIRTPTPHQLMEQGPTTGSSKDDDEYCMRHAKRGLALIFNHNEFDPREYPDSAMYRPPKRVGTKFDRDRLVSTFSKLGFEVECLDDLRYKEIKHKLEGVADQDHSKHDCLAVVVLTHGDSDSKLHARDKEYDSRKLWKHFRSSECRSLAGKPKLFFIQACKGRTREIGFPVRGNFGNSTDTTQNKEHDFQVTSHADILVSYSTFEGHFSYRSPTEGSLYVQTLCSQLEKSAAHKDLMSILVDVNRFVVQQGLSGQEQTPCFKTSLTRRVYLRPPTTS